MTVLPIPEMTHPLGRAWQQPKREEIKILFGHAFMSKEAFGKLHDYSHSRPSAVYPGKMWRCLLAGMNYLVWYGECEDQNKCSVNHLKIIIE